MTDHARAIEAGARAFKQRRRDEIEGKVERATFEEMTGIIIEAAIASGALVPASAVAAERERCAHLIDYWPTPGKPLSLTELENRDFAMAAAIRALSPEPASGEVVVVPAKPIGWFNPWNDYHGFQQVAEEFEGGPDTIPLYADQKTHDDLKTAMLNAATKDGERK